MTTWYALWAPKGTSKEIVDKVQQEIVKMLQLPDIKELWAANAAEPGGQSPVEFEAFMKREIARWAKVVKDAGAKIDL